VEEFMQMLLSFPLDPSPAVIEIISDSIYANSSTLDGRRFAAEFCQKRKADAAAARAKPGSTSGSKVPRASLADGKWQRLREKLGGRELINVIAFTVVKTQPKPVQSEWGFKTVQKKPKGGRK
jgi:PERQ amino acid-rich with GYF domain-containing protein